MRALVVALDDRYLEPFKVLWHSLNETDSIPPGTPVCILHGADLTYRSKQKLESMAARYERTVSFFAVRREVTAPLPEVGHVSRTTYVRLYVSSLLPCDITSAVYLDVDTIAVKSIRELFHWDLSHPLAAVDHCSPGDAIRMWGPAGGSYFQAGVLLLDLNAWRSRDIEQTFHEIIARERSRLALADQDVLNIAFRDNWQRLPWMYNFGGHVRAMLTRHEQREEACLIHFDGRAKPWNRYDRSWHTDRWYQLHRHVSGLEGSRRLIRRLLWERVRGPVRRVLS